jgi:hypothetical protein
MIDRLIPQPEQEDSSILTAAVLSCVTNRTIQAEKYRYYVYKCHQPLFHIHDHTREIVLGDKPAVPSAVSKFAALLTYSKLVIIDERQSVSLIVSVQLIPAKTFPKKK